MLNYLINIIHNRLCTYRTLHRLLVTEQFQEYYKSISTNERLTLNVYILSCDIHSIRRMMKTQNKYEGMKLSEIRRVAASLKIKNYLYKQKELLIDEILEIEASRE